MISTPAEMLRYVAEWKPEWQIGNAEPLSGGLLNYVWRLRSTAHSQNHSWIAKVAPPFIASVPDVPLDPARITIEAQCLEWLQTLEILKVPVTRTPKLIHFDREHHLLLMEDLGDLPDLEVGFYRWTGPSEHLQELAVQIGRQLGHLIGALHCSSYNHQELSQTFNNITIQTTRYHLQYCNIEQLCTQIGVADAAILGQRAVELGSRWLNVDRCLIMGDLWPRSVLVKQLNERSNGAAVDQETDQTYLIDWEMAHYGSPAQDLAHFIAHLWMLGQQAPTPRIQAAFQTLRTTFLNTYRSVIDPIHTQLIDPQVLRDCHIHFGCEILVRSVGAFQSGYVYDGFDHTAEPIQTAVQVAINHLRDPEDSHLFRELG